MENVEIWFLLLALVMTTTFSVFVYIMMYEVPQAPYPNLQFTTVDGWEIHYREAGHGPPLLLLHGIGASLHSWHNVFPLLAERFHVVALDLPGFGQSGKQPDAKYGLDDQTERIERFLDKMGIGECLLAGNSMGGTLALWLAKRHPTRFPYIVAIAPAANPKLIPWLADKVGFLSGPASWLFLRPIAARMHRVTLSRSDRMSEDRVTQTLSVYRRNPLAIRTFLAGTTVITDPRMLSESFESRVLVLWGQKDRCVPRWTIDRLMPRLTDATLVVHPTGGHQLQEDEPEWTFEQIARFLPDSTNLSVSHKQL